jgi:hypothetical protein
MISPQAMNTTLTLQPHNTTMQRLWTVARHLLRTTCVCAGLLAVAAPALAQRDAEQQKKAEMGRRIATTVALADDYSAGEPYRILRNMPGKAHDVILLPRQSATGADLVDAVLALGMVRDANGDSTSRTNLVRTRGGGIPRGSQSAEVVRAQRVIDRLKTLPPNFTVPGFGRTSATDIYLPSKAMRAERRKVQRP